jgi:hypothetical protein
MEHQEVGILGSNLVLIILTGDVLVFSVCALVYFFPFPSFLSIAQSVWRLGHRWTTGIFDCRLWQTLIFPTASKASLKSTQPPILWVLGLFLQG